MRVKVRKFAGAWMVFDARGAFVAYYKTWADAYDRAVWVARWL